MPHKANISSQDDQMKTPVEIDFRVLVQQMRLNANTDEELAQRVAAACAMIADRVRHQSIVGDAGAAIRSIFKVS